MGVLDRREFRINGRPADDCFSEERLKHFCAIVALQMLDNGSASGGKALRDILLRSGSGGRVFRGHSAGSSLCDRALRDVHFFPAQGEDGAQIITPGKKHLEIDKSRQRFRAYDERGRRVFEAPVSTGKPGIDEKGRQSSETLSGIHRIVEVKPFKRWSKDPRVKMLDWIGIAPGIEKGMHSLNPVGEFAGYEKLLGQKASHRCIRLSRESSRWLMRWIGEEWKIDPLIVYIYDQTVLTETPSQESRYLLFLVLQEGMYTYPSLSQEEIPTLQRSDPAQGLQMKLGAFSFIRKGGRPGISYSRTCRNGFSILG